MLRLLAFIFRWELVWLQDFQGKVYLTKTNNNPFGKYAHIYHFTKIGHVVLNDDETCSGESSYIKRWKPYR